MLRRPDSSTDNRIRIPHMKPLKLVLAIVTLSAFQVSCGGHLSIPIGHADSLGESVDKYGDFSGAEPWFEIPIF